MNAEDEDELLAATQAAASALSVGE